METVNFLVDKCHKMRSNILKKGSLPTEPEEEAVLVKLLDIVRRIIRVYIEDPSATCNISQTVFTVPQVVS
ncbi:MAG: hypothetical protein ACI8RA_001270 [Chlamydiales bacterium]